MNTVQRDESYRFAWMFIEPPPSRYGNMPIWNVCEARGKRKRRWDGGVGVSAIAGLVSNAAGRLASSSPRMRRCGILTFDMPLMTYTGASPTRAEEREDPARSVASWNVFILDEAAIER